MNGQIRGPRGMSVELGKEGQNDIPGPSISSGADIAVD